MKSDYHGNFLDISFTDPNFIHTFKYLYKRKSRTNPWMMYDVIIPENELGNTIQKVQDTLKDDAPYYNHLYRENELIVIFKKKVFRMTLDKSTWNEAIAYGRSLNIPDSQLVFSPNRFGDEEYYFSKQITSDD